MLARENQHALCIAARKFRNLHVFGCWWFLNNPSIIEEMTRMLLESGWLAEKDDAFVLTGPMGAGNPGNLGPCALIDIDGVRVMVVSHKVQALDQAILRHVGVEPSACPILVLKSSVHFRADFGPIAERIIVGIAPGPVVADPAILNFRYVRPDVRRRPRIG